MKHCAVILACGCLLGSAPVPADDLSSQRDLEAQLSSLAREDPDSPAVLEARLERVNTLLKSGEGCQGRLAAAQDALKDAGSSPALGLLLPLGSARLASLEYELHRARARCAADRGSADKELQAAVSAAQRAVALYRDGLDYLSMAIMQFNVAVTQRSLGDPNAALAALSSAVDMDHEFGLADDARDNERLLAQWRAPITSTQAAAASGAKLPDAPAKRSATLRFAWTASEADETIELSSTSLVQGHLGHVGATRTMQRHVRPSYVDTDWGWRVSYELAEPAQGEAKGFAAGARLFGLAVPVTHALLELPTIDVSPSGDLRGYVDLATLGKQLRKGAEGTLTADGKTDPEYGAVEEEFNPDSIAGRAKEAYGLETEAWIGATLEQGVWYRMSAGLSLPGLVDTVLPHDIEFAYTRNVACTPDAQVPACVEIVAHATPNAEALDHLIGSMSSFFQTAAYWSTTYVRLVTDPRSLTPYGLDVRRYWHILGRPDSKRMPESGMERVVKTYQYHPKSAQSSSAGH